MKFKYKILFLLLLPVYLFAENKQIENTSESVESFISDLVATLYTELPTKKSQEEVFDFFYKYTEDKFAFTYMSKWLAGNYLKGLPNDLLNKYLQESKNYMVIRYGDIFNSYYKQYTYRVTQSEKKSDTEYSVRMIAESKSQAVKDQGTIINIDWKVRYSDKDKRFYVVDLTVNNINFLSSQRAEFLSLIKSKNDNFAAFVDLLAEKVANIRKK